jgi:hypothetical protein
MKTMTFSCAVACAVPVRSVRFARSVSHRTNRTDNRTALSLRFHGLYAVCAVCAVISLPLGGKTLNLVRAPGDRRWWGRL